MELENFNQLYNMKMNIINLLILSMLFSCSKKSASVDPETPPIVIVQPVQYGTPFSQVPDPSDAVIYQVNIRAFSNAGNLQGVIARLDSIKALGVNVIYLMPVNPVGTTRAVNSPYCIKDYENVGAEFGSLTDLRAMVSAAHDRNMAVIMDWVANHTSWDHPWITANKSWYKQDASGNIISPPNTGWNDVAQLDFSKTDMRKAMIKAMQSWVYNANIDGYRCDAADFVPADFWKQAIDSLRNISTHKLLMFAEGTRSDHFTAGFQLEYGMGFYYNLKNRIFTQGGSVQTIDSINNVEYINAGNQNQVVRYTSNHDVDLSDGTPAELFGGNNGALTSFMIATLMKGVPMIYCGQEIGYSVRLNYFNNTTPITWTPTPAITNAYKAILAFRKSSAAIKTGALSSYSSNDVCAFVKTSGTEKVMVIANLRNANINYAVPAAFANTSWTNVFVGGQQTIGNTDSISAVSVCSAKKLVGRLIK